MYLRAVGSNEQREGVYAEVQRSEVAALCGKQHSAGRVQLTSDG